MTHDWTPSAWGQRLTRTPHWRLALIEQRAELLLDGHLHHADLTAPDALTLQRGLLWTRLHLTCSDGQVRVLEGLSNAAAQTLAQALEQRRGSHQDTQRIIAFNDGLVQVRDWLAQADAAIAGADARHHWFTHEQQQDLLAQRPSLPLDASAMWAVFDDAALRARLDGTPSFIEDALMRWEADWPAAWVARNADHLQHERRRCSALLDGIERQPLTAEQAQAVICFDNRVQLVAAAGSGKTSTLVAKAAYAIARGLVPAERILMLAFNKDAAEELQQRAETAFARVGLDGSEVQARTFHALGRKIIGKATGRLPDVPGWAVDATQGFHKLAELIDQLKDRSHRFRTQWDLFRLVFGRDLPVIGGTTQADGWEADGQGYVRTLQGERVRDLEDCIIADWLFYNGVAYRYERQDAFDPADDAYHRFSPAFHYPAAGLSHQHRRVDPTPARGGHRDQIQTTPQQLRSGELFTLLGEALSKRGVVLDPNPDRELPDGGATPMPDTELIGLVRSFISHAKSNGLSVDDMAERLRCMPEDRFKHRYRLFLALATPVLEAWDDALAAEHAIDFEDMLNQAAEHLEQGRYHAPYELVMADEFQDASRARARLCRALVQAPGRHLFAVGDDWQSINRFAGADVSVMTGFVDWFGPGQVLKLEQTFRCPQALCDASSRFIAKNPAQIAKQVRSHAAAQGPVLQAFQVAARDQLGDAIGQYLQRLQQQVIAAGKQGRLSVFVLGRYNNDRSVMAADWPARFGQHLEISFLTAHRAKGAEADIVILPAMLERSFPSTRADDPVLRLAMPQDDTYPLGEERRLFYVALTRARRSVAMFTVQGKRSSFLNELVADGAVQISGVTGQSIHEQACPVCDGGVIVQRTGPYGPFQSCSSYPRCQYKPRQMPGQRSA